MSEVSEVSELASDALIEDLRLIVGMANVVVDADMRLGFETDWLGRRRGAARVAVRPADTGEVAEVVKACAAAGAVSYTHLTLPTNREV